MNVLLFVGFLGSGKTSILMPLARFLVAREDGGFDKTSVVIIENEIGEVAIDDAVLRREGLNVRELFGGCVCCQLTADLVSCLNEIAADINPGCVMVEVTGLGIPQRIVDTINRYGRGIENVVTVAVVDAERWYELVEVLEPLVTKQVEGADLVLVNKIDLIDEAGLLALKESLGGINSSAPVLSVSATTGISQDVLREVAGV